MLVNAGGRRSGFTLVEMLAVLVIISVVAALGALKLRRRNQGAAVAGLAQEVFARAAEARFLALSSGCQAQLSIDPAAQQVASVQLATQPGMNPSPLVFAPAMDGAARRRDAKIKAIAAGSIFGGSVPSGPAAPDALVFYPDGTAKLRSAAGQVGATLYFSDAQGGNPYRLVVFGRTGFAKVVSH